MACFIAELVGDDDSRYDVRYFDCGAAEYLGNIREKHSYGFIMGVLEKAHKLQGEKGDHYRTTREGLENFKNKGAGRPTEEYKINVVPCPSD